MRSSQRLPHRSARVMAGVSAVAMLVLAACGTTPGDQAVDGTGDPTVATDRDAAADDGIVLITAGTNPTTRFRYEPDGVARTYTMTTTQKIDQTINGRKQPSAPEVAIAMDLTVISVPGDNPDTIKTSVAYDNARLVDPSRFPAEVLAEVGAMLVPVNEITQTAITTMGGRVLESTSELPDSLDPTTRSIVEQLEGSVEQMTLPVPPDALGVGAKWTSGVDIDLLGSTNHLVMTYTITAIEDDAIEFDVDYTQSIQPGDQVTVDTADGPVEMKFISGEITGSGRMRIMSATTMASHTDMTAGGRLSMAASIDGETHGIVQDQTMQVTLDLIG